MLLVIPMRAVEQAITALVRNAIDASPEDAPVVLAARAAGQRREGNVQFVVRDRGCGMSGGNYAARGGTLLYDKGPR